MGGRNTLAGGRMDKGGVCFDEDIVEKECKINKKQKNKLI